MTDLELLESFAKRFNLNVELFNFQHSNGNLVEDEAPYFVDYRTNDEETLQKCLSQQDTHTKFDIIHNMLDELEWGN